MSLRRRLAAEIAADGPLTVARYMDACLHDPQGGYYTTRPALGGEGDFVTAPLVSQMFGELLGLWCAEAWARLGRPTPVRWVEMGPGDGTLQLDMRRALLRAAPDFLAAADSVLVERSAPLREIQAERLVGSPARWVETLDAVGGGAPVILVANELLDCLPARQFLRDAAGRWAERRVGLAPDGEALAFGLAPPPADFRPPPGLEDAAPGIVVEVSPAQAAVGAAIGGRIARDGGAALLIDYGRDRPEGGDTLQALRRHEKVDPLASPGEADLTVHVDFPAVAAAARAAGAATAMTTQGDLLRALGIEARFSALARARPDRTDTLGRQLRRLVAPDEMGALFKALAITSPQFAASGLAAPGFPDPPA